MDAPHPLFSKRRAHVTLALLSLLHAQFARSAFAQSSVSGQMNNAIPISIQQSTSGPALDILPPLAADDPPNAPGLLTNASNSALQYALHLLTRAVYDDNINLSRTNRTHDWYFGIHPMLMLGAGDINKKNEPYVRLDYVPSVFRYVDHPGADSDQHQIHLQAGFTEHELTLTLNQDVQILHEINLEAVQVGGPTTFETTGRTAVNVFSTRVDANYNFSRDSFVTGAFSGTATDYEQPLISSRIFFGNIYFGHHFNPQFTAGFGVEDGYTIVDNPNPDQPFQQANFRFAYNPTQQLKINGIIGAEVREFLDHGRDVYATPVFDLGATYTPRDGTQVTLNSSRSISPSATLVAQDFASTGVNMTLRQRIGSLLFVAASAGYVNADYFNVRRHSHATAGSEDYYYVQPSLDLLLTKTASLGVYYLYRESDSSFAGAGFTNNQFGVRGFVKF